MDSTYEYIDEISIDPELICSICHSPLIDPCCTPCGETFCRKCIMNWMETKINSCPHCRQKLSMNSLTLAPRSLRNMIDRLRIKCMICGQNGLLKINLEEHMQKVCPKTMVSCRSADIKCPWIGQRDQLDEHLNNCRFEGMRSIITELIMENQQLEDRLNEQISQINNQQEKIRQLKELLNVQKDQYLELQNESEAQFKMKIHTYEHQHQQYTEQLKEKELQLTSIPNQSSQFDVKYSFITIFE
ncbi:hypothetical protein I4U23_002665 [Adineta vaga]|nr:hypothetical protein I4U23_002665 [Adineta vaga]